MAVWLVGASFVCPRCLLRGLASPCPKCGGPVEDLAQPGGFDRLATTWRAGRAWLAGRSLLSPRAIPHLRALLVLSGVVAFVNALAPVLGPALVEKHAPQGAELALALGVGVVFAPILLAFYALFFFGMAHVCRLLALLFGGVAQVTPLGAARFSIGATLFRWMSRPLLPQVELAFPSQSAAGATSQRGVLAQPLTVHVLRDGLSFIERFDAWCPAPAMVTLDGKVVEVPLHAGAVSLEPTTGTREAFKGEVPAWLNAPRRPGTSFTREVPAGTPVTVERRGDLVFLRFSPLSATTSSGRG